MDSLITSKLQEIKVIELEKNIGNSKIDITIPGVRPETGSVHPITQMMQKTEEIFEKMGFEIYTPFEIDDDYHNFTSLNMPEGHPARDAWDTFWTEDEHILITHTSSMQNRILKSANPPIRAIVPGKCFRNEATDATHEAQFFQCEGLYVDRAVSLAQLKWTLLYFFKKYLGQDAAIRLRPSFFPFTEPSVEVDVKYGDKWLEMAGAGLVHPNVFKSIGLEGYTGFAFGTTIDRFIMVKYGVPDIRQLYSGDLRLVNQF